MSVLSARSVGSRFAVRVGAPVVAAFALAVGAIGCAGNDEDEPTGRIVVGTTVIPVAGGRVERITVGDVFSEVAFSPDQSQVAFSSDPEGIVIKTLRDGGTTIVPDQPSQERFLTYGVAWSPDGKALAFVNGDRVFTITTDGSELRKLGSGVDPVWTPDGEHIVFASGNYTGLDQDIAVVRVDGTGLRILGRGLYPDVSPSGDEVAYSTSTGVFVMPLAGGEPGLVVANGFGPVWSPDGRFLAFTRYTECGHAACSGRIFVVPVEGGEPRAMGPTIGDPGGPDQWIR